MITTSQFLDERPILSRLPRQNWLGAALTLAVLAVGASFLARLSALDLGWPFVLALRDDPAVWDIAVVAVIWVGQVLVSRGVGKVLAITTRRTSARRGYWLVAMAWVFIVALDWQAGSVGTPKHPATVPGAVRLVVEFLGNALIALVSLVSITPWFVKCRPGSRGVAVGPLIACGVIALALCAFHATHAQPMRALGDLLLAGGPVSAVVIARASQNRFPRSG